MDDSADDYSSSCFEFDNDAIVVLEKEAVEGVKKEAMDCHSIYNDRYLYQGSK